MATNMGTWLGIIPAGGIFDGGTPASPNDASGIGPASMGTLTAESEASSDPVSDPASDPPELAPELLVLDPEPPLEPVPPPLELPLPELDPAPELPPELLPEFPLLSLPHPAIVAGTAALATSATAPASRYLRLEPTEKLIVDPRSAGPGRAQSAALSPQSAGAVQPESKRRRGSDAAPSGNNSSP
jgi:hypothetical protein